MASKVTDGVSLREITADTVIAVIKLTVAEDQKGFVAPNAVSLAQALFSEDAWFRAICVGDELAGFVMLADESQRSQPPGKPRVSLWRLMIDARFQRRGVGRAAIQRVIELLRARGCFDVLETSYVPGPGSPEPFYLGLGFRHTGRIEEGETVLELPLR
jgi:diamine N-acetyltransferase